ncbi:hypothetical protein [Thermocrinis minervae]|uniref:Uncharacterized protein n=1 Tax=Thermocrinis minervae TaxID=381751 RepID=A0A1M6SZ22_9AQUI|nr:hypothetical protein [Thermocrinis minervae]SHK49869.1 hypothetical protein SAMN05444391_1224 [Thermocrinis minervae]
MNNYMTEEKPIMVLKYQPLRVISFIMFLGIPAIGMGFIGLLFMSKEHSKNLFDYYFVKYFGSVWIIIIGSYLVIDLVNTDRIELYKNKIVKIYRIPLFSDKKEIYLNNDTHIFMTWSSIRLYDKKPTITNRIISFLFIFFSNAFFIHINRFNKKDQERFADFLSEISGRPKEYFLYRSDSSIKPLIIKNKEV